MKRAALAALSMSVALGAPAPLAILERRCVACHGPTTKTAGLDLTSPAAARAAAAKIATRVSEGKMPPAAPLPGEERESIARWIAAGLPWEGVVGEKRAGPDWWSLQPLRPVRGGIDSLFPPPRPEADRRTLIRRLSFDLTGLPPDPVDIDRFLADPRPDAWARLVDRMLASPHYGERWARHWLDVVRFAESEGFERDLLREHAWRYRDYVVRSFNDDKPYIQFAREQIAGDAIQSATRESIAATGMLVSGPYDAVGLTSAVYAERKLIREDQLEEMVGAVAQAFLGLTVNCARCHDHKFDPITQREYYQFKAAFEGVWQPVAGTELSPHGRPLLTPAEARDRESREAPLRESIARIEADQSALFARARARLLPPPGSATAPIAAWNFDADSRDRVGALHLDLGDSPVEIAQGRLRALPGKRATLSTPTLPRDLREKTLEVWAFLRKAPDKAAPTAMQVRNQSGFRGAAVDGIQLAGQRWRNTSTVQFRTADVGGPPEEAREGDRLHIAIAYAADGTIAIYRNGEPYGKPYKPDTSIPAGRLQTYNQGDAVVQFQVTPEIDIDEARLHERALTPEQVRASFATGAPSATIDQLLASMSPPDRERADQLRRSMASARAALKAIPPPDLAFSVDSREPEPVHVLVRGDVGQLGERVEPAALSAIRGKPGSLGLDASAPDRERRLRLADWIANDDNPLFARVMANRIWQHHFGAGLVDNPSDFGFNGGTPSNPDLLEWLAGEFRRSGWSVKSLHRAILLSGAYRQASTTPRRLDAESVRDAMLAASRLINTEMFGPSFRPFEAKPSGSYQGWSEIDNDSRPLQRRTIYRMNVNSGGSPMLEALDCPVPAVKSPKRPVTTTALQALSLMNSRFVNRQAAAFASRLRREAGDDAVRVRRAFLVALGREPDERELGSSLDLAARHGLEQLCWGLFNTSEFVHVR
jgi:mono/diheme cytochrome c family protein